MIIPSETTDRLCRIAQRARINIVMGPNELATETGAATCYNTLLYIDAQGQILGKHRSLVVTDAERLVWAQGDGSTLRVHTLPIATISGLIGAEHYLPLARHALYAWGTQIYLATTWDRGEPWLSTVRHIAKEGRVFVLSCGMALHTDDILASNSVKQLNSDGIGTWLHPGDSVIVNPNGEFIAGPVREKEEILYAEVDPSQLCESGWMLDGVTHDARPDIFQLTVLHNEERISTLPN